VRSTSSHAATRVTASDVFRLTIGRSTTSLSRNDGPLSVTNGNTLLIARDEACLPTMSTSTAIP